MEIKKDKTFKLVLLIISFILQALVLCTLLLNYLSFTNTLSKKENWQVSKNQLFYPASDGTVFRDQTQALATNSLDLSVWRAWNEVYIKDVLAWKTLSLKFLASENSYLYVIFNRNEENFSAIRISYSPLFESALINAKYTGEFTEIIPISTIFLSNSEWQNLTLKKSNAKSSTIEFWYNNKLITSHSFLNSAEGNIAFRVGQEQILIDNIRVTGEQNQTLFSENFDQFDKFLPIFIFLLLILIIFDLILFFLVRVKEKKLKLFIQLNFTICLILLSINSIFLFFSAKIRIRYPNNDSFFNKIKFQNNNQKYSEFKETESDYFLSKYATDFSEENITRIMFIGSSQTKGEGSCLEGEDFVSQFSMLIEKNQKNEENKFEIINTGMPGLLAGELFDLFKEKWINLKPNIVIVNLSSNDEQYNTQSSFKKAMEDFVQISKNNGFLLVFMAEANSIEKNIDLEAHQIMKNIAEKNDIIFIDMHEYLSNYIKSGILWWDFVHPTSFGYQLIANHLFESLKPIILSKEMN